jgi:tetratricopeptide (TPR) repeat protein
MKLKNLINTSILLCAILVITASHIATADEAGVLLYKGRQALSAGNLDEAINWFTQAVAKCPPEHINYDRCYFFLGESYFKRFEINKSQTDAQRALESFEQVLNIGDRSRQGNPEIAIKRIIEINRTLADIELRNRGKSPPFFSVKMVPKGAIVAHSYKISVGEEPLDSPFWEAFFVQDVLGAASDSAGEAIYLSDAAAAEIARRLGIDISNHDDRPEHDRYGILNIARTFHKTGYSDVTLRNGERFNNNQWAIIEYELNMPALPASVFERFGCSVEENWSEQTVIIHTKKLKVIEGSSESTIDWFLKTNTTKLPSHGSGGDWIIGFDDFRLQQVIYPKQTVSGNVTLRIKENAVGSANAVLYVSLFGDWSPSIELARIYRGTVGQPRLLSIPFSFTAPSEPGTYRLRCPMVLAFAPVKNFYGSEPRGQNDPGIGPYTEVTFQVVGNNTLSVARPEVETPVEAAKKYLNACWELNCDEMTKYVSEDIWIGDGKGNLVNGKEAFRERCSHFSAPKEPLQIVRAEETQRTQDGTICRVEVALKKENNKEDLSRLWFKNVNGHWLLFTPSLSLDGYSEQDVQSAFRAYIREFTKRGPHKYSDQKLIKAMPNYQGSDFLIMEVEETHQSIDYDTERPTGPATRSTHGIVMHREGGQWKYAGPYF